MCAARHRGVRWKQLMSESIFNPSWYRVADLHPRLRAHARIHRHEYRGDIWYVLQDPLSGQYYRFSPSAYQQQKLEGEVEKLKVGMSINYLVLSFQRDLADAQTLELKALTEYRISLANLDKVMGVGREKQNVNVVLESR